MEGIRAEIATIISEIAEVPYGSIEDNTSMEELGIDSLDALRIVAAIEKKYRVEIPEEEIGEVETFADILRMVAASGLTSSS